MASSDMMPRFNIWRFLPLALLLVALAYGISQGWHHAYSARNIADRIDDLQMRAEMELTFFICAYVITYVVVVALSLPGATILTLLGGFVFGWMIAGPVTVVSATIGATIIFMVAKSALGDLLRARAGPLLDGIAHGFQRDAFNYMLFLRLVPAFPFWLVNIAPAFLGVRVRTYTIATLLGIIPGTFAFAYAGGSLDSVFGKARQDEGFQTCLAEEASGARMEGSCALPIDLGDVITTELLIAISALGVLALIPTIVRHLALARGMRDL